MTTNWQDPQAAAPPPQNHNSNNPKKRFALVAVLLVVIAGLAAAAGLVMANRSDDGGNVADDAQYVVMDAPSTTPVFEPAFAAGDDPFFPLDTQLIAYQAEAEEEIAAQVAIAQAEAEPGEDIVVPVFDVAELEENVKTGLYGGTEENTCDPERLISFLIAHPKIGEAWAQVQGIEFNEIPEYIRGLEVRVLAADLAVQNHGYDVTTQSAYAIDSVLAAGTAVLVDENGDVRTRCYCGNPIVPKPPVNYMPPRCIIWGASVFTVPGGTDRRDNAPTDVLLTGRQALRPDGAVWVEVKWGTSEDQSGWVRHDWVRNHYCPPPTYDYECPGPDEVPVYGNDKTTVVGFVTGTLDLHDGPTEIYAPIEAVSTGAGDVTIEDGFLLIHFTRVGPSNNGWVNTDDLNQDDENCHHIPQCVEITQNVRSRPGGADLGPGYSGKMWVEYTGKFAPENRAYTEVRLLDFGSQVGWIAPLFVTNLAPQECDDTPINNCVDRAIVYENSTGADQIGTLNNAEVIILSAVPQDGRININMAPGGPEGWVDEGNFMGGWNKCEPVPECYETAGDAYTIFETDGAVLPMDATPRIIGLVGKRAETANPKGPYLRIEEGGVRYWILAGELVQLLPEECELDAECPDPYPDFSDETITEITLLGAGPLRFVKAQNPDSDVQRGPDPNNGGETPTNECCVTALFNTKDDLDPSGTSVPRVVTVIATDNADPDLAWYTTSDSDYFQRIHVAVSADACTPECPEYEGGDDEITMDDVLDNPKFGSIAYTKVTPEQAVKYPGDWPGERPGDGCCVNELHVGIDTGNLIPFPEFVTVEAGPLSGPGGEDWFRTDTGQHFPEGAVTNPAECERDIDCPTSSFRDLIDEIGKIGGIDNVGIRGPGFASSESYVKSLLPEGFNPCCVDADSVLYDGPGTEPGDATTEPRLVTIEDVSPDGMWVKVLFLDDLTPSWVSVDALVPTSECDTDDAECPRQSTTYNEDKELLCCVQLEDGSFELVPVDEITDETMFADEGRCINNDNPCESPTTVRRPGQGRTDACCIEGDDGSELVTIDELDEDMVQVPAEYCEPVIECPGLDNNFAINVGNAGPLECCVTVNGATVKVTLTGNRQEVPSPGSGVWEYEVVPGDVWYLASEFEPDKFCFDPPAVSVPPVPEPTRPPVPTTPPVVQDPCAGQGGDTDGDGVCDNRDNCDNDRNPGQADKDDDGAGDACDPSDDRCRLYGGDADGDGICDDNDPCSAPDRDGNGYQDDCEPACADVDQDDVCDDDDLCPGVFNPGNTYPYQDGTSCVEGPVCDLGDQDDDQVCDDIDICPGVYNPGNTYPYDGSCTPPATCSDRDGDTFCDKDDLCPDLFTSFNEYPFPNNPTGNPCVPDDFLSGGNGTLDSGGAAGTGATAPGTTFSPGTFTPSFDLPPLVLIPEEDELF